jgi:hypothetical protein
MDLRPFKHLTSMIPSGMEEAVILPGRYNLVEFMNEAAEKLTGLKKSDKKTCGLETVINLLKHKQSDKDRLSTFITEKNCNGGIESEKKIRPGNRVEITRAEKVIPYGIRANLTEPS